MGGPDGSVMSTLDSSFCLWAERVKYFDDNSGLRLLSINISYGFFNGANAGKLRGMGSFGQAMELFRRRAALEKRPLVRVSRALRKRTSWGIPYREIFAIVSLIL